MRDRTTLDALLNCRLILVFALALGGFLRFANLGALEMSPDEGASWGAASAPDLSQVIARQAELNPGKLPIHDLMLHGWIAIFGGSLIAIRAMSAALGTLAILLVYFVARELFLMTATRDDADTALVRDDLRLIAAVSAMVFAVSLVSIKYSREARMYPVMLAATLAQVAFFLRAIRLGALPDYFAVALLTAIAVGSNFSALLIPVMEGIWLLYIALRARLRFADSSVIRAIATAVALAAGGVALIPKLLLSFGATTAGTAGGIIRWIKPPSLFEPIAMFNKATGSFCFPVLVALAIFGALVSWRRGAHDAIAFALLWMWAPPILMMLASYTLTPIFVERYALSCFVPFFILVAGGIFETLANPGRAVALLMVVILSLGHIHSYDLKAHDAQYREATAAAESALKPGQVMTVVPAYAIEVVRFYLPTADQSRAIRYRPGATAADVLILGDQHIAPAASATYRRQYPQVVAHLRGVVVLRK